jgi:hypothetical protein
VQALLRGGSDQDGHEAPLCSQVLDTLTVPATVLGRTPYLMGLSS